jgi:hypothetical protein
LYSNNNFQACWCNGQLRIASESSFKWLSAELEPTNIRLKVDLSQYLALKPKTGSKLPVYCLQCQEDCELDVTHFRRDRKLPPCFCAGRRKGPTASFASEQGKRYLHQQLAKTRFQLVDPAEMDTIVSDQSHLHVKCNDCDLVVNPNINKLLQSKVGCLCPGHYIFWDTDNGRERLRDIINASRFQLVDANDLFSIKTEDSRIRLLCPKCKLVVSPTVGNLVQNHVGCGCNNESELKVYNAVNDHMSFYPGFFVERQYTDPQLLGVGGRELRFDLVVLKKLWNGTDELVVFVESDGGHHFFRNFSYNGPGHANPHAFEHDLRKERHVLSKGLAMLRIDCRTILEDKADWEMWLHWHIALAVNDKLSTKIHRLSHKNLYSKSDYADARRDDPALAVDPAVVQAYESDSE